MKNNPSTQKGGKDSKHERISDLVLAAPYSPEEASFQDTRVETKKIPDVETRSTRHCARKARNKSNVHKKECDPYSLRDESNEHKEETEPGAYNVARTHSESHPVQEPQTTINGPYIVDGDVNEERARARAMLVEADLAPELTSAEEVIIQEEEAVIAKKIQYQRALRFAMSCYGLANIGNIVGFVLLLLNQPLVYGQIYEPIWFGLFESACLFFIAALRMLQETTRGCYASTISLELYAPDDKELLRETYIASVVTFCLFTCVAIPIIVLLPKLQWLGYTCMTWYFAGTLFIFSRVQLLRRSKETRQKKPKIFWIIFLSFFLGLSGATIWRCLNVAYPDCDVPLGYWIGDSVCDGYPYLSEVCGYDGGDCAQFSKDYPGCIVDSPRLIGSGFCDGEAYNTIECRYDGGDCVKDYPDCIVPNPSWIGDGRCDGRLYGTVECGFDGGDCLGPGKRCRGHRECASEVCNSVTKVCDSGFASDLYPNCSVVIPDWIGDGECDGGYYASEACGFDGGDCL